MLADLPGAGAAPLLVHRPIVGLPAIHDTPAGFRRQVKPQQFMVALGYLPGEPPVAKLLGQPVNLIVKDVGQPLEEQQRQQVVLELGRVPRPPDGTGRVPKHLLHRLGGGNGCR